MGLLGGFKGKLISKHRKEKKSGGADAVCVKFFTFSEFDGPNNLPSCSNTNLGKNDVIKERRRPSRPEIASVFPQSASKLNGDAEKSQKNKKIIVNGAPKIAENHTAPTIDVPQTSTIPDVVKPTKVKAPPIPTIEAPTQNSERLLTFHDDDDEDLPSPIVLTKSPLFAQTNHLDSDDDDNFKINIVEKNSSAVGDDDGNFPIYVAQSSKKEVADSDDDGNFKINLLQNSATNTDEEKFKVHIAQNIDHNAEDEQSSDDETVILERSSIDYSSQAASIFFGEEEEPVISRPRKVILNNDDDDDDDDNRSDGSSASA